MVVLIASFQVSAEKEDRFENAFRKVLPQVRFETGLMRYVLHKAEGIPGKYLLYESYQDQGALDYHMARPYIVDLLAELPSYLSGPPGIEYYKDVAAIHDGLPDAG